MKKTFLHKNQKTFWIKLTNIAMSQLFFLSAFAVVVSLLLLIGYIFINGIKILNVVSLHDFIFGLDWEPVTRKLYGIFPMIITSFYVTFGAVLISAPLGIACAVFLAEIAPLYAQEIVRPAVQLLAGIPSVIYGLFGLCFIVPIIQRFSEVAGLSILAAILILSIMILPTIITISEDAIRAVPRELRESSLALGTTKWQTIYGTVLPACSSGILTAISLGIGRAFGEAIAVKMVIGNTQTMPDLSSSSLFGLLSLARTLTTNIICDIEYAEVGPHKNALFATGAVLFIFIMIVNGIYYFFFRRFHKVRKAIF